MPAVVAIELRATQRVTNIARIFQIEGQDGPRRVVDLFVINNSPRPVLTFDLKNTRDVRDPLGGAKLYRNDGGHFVDVSAAAGIYGSEIGLGLGVVVSDVNRDGWPDIYVANDFSERDYLYLNNGDGTFAERLEQEMPYISLSSMGLDIADINNDGWPDIYVADMLPDDEHRDRKSTRLNSSHGYISYAVFCLKKKKKKSNIL